MEQLTQYEREELIALMQYALGNEIEDGILGKLDKSVERWTWERFKRTDKAIETWTWERFKRVRDLFESEERTLEAARNRVTYHAGEKIRLAILYQIPSCWPSIESFYEAVKADDRFEVTVLLYDEEQKEAAQMAGAREYLEGQGIPFEDAASYDFRRKRPHIVLYQTPWDVAHRPRFLQSDMIGALGSRIAYIPYGINYSASVYPDYIFSDLKFKMKPWFIAGLSKWLKKDHNLMSERCGHNVFVTGLPKFDAYANLPERDNSRHELIKGRKVVYLQMHFPDKAGMPHYPVPSIREYVDFLRKADQYKDVFFILRPHPKFFEAYEKKGFVSEVEEMRAIVESRENILLDEQPDYREMLLRADYVMGDRSALMIEAGSLGIPVLYLTNFYYEEKLLPAVAPLFESFYRGNSAYDMERFMDMVVMGGMDYKKEERQRAVEECIPYRDGKCGQRIADAMAELLMTEGEE